MRVGGLQKYFLNQTTGGLRLWRYLQAGQNQTPEHV
jgi:hypothetical protein